VKDADILLSECKNLDPSIDVPPRADLRSFNENDILGQFDRDTDGRIVVVTRGSDGRLRDKEGNLTTAKGYLLDPKTGSVVEN
jgi:hypothetical protein